MTDLQSYAILFLLCLISTILIRSILSKTRSTTRLPPSPFALPIIGHLHLLAPIPHQAFHKLSQRHGQIIHLRLGSVPAVFVCSADTAKEMLKTHEASIASRPISSAVGHLTYGTAAFAFCPCGPYWKFLKKLCVSELLGGRTLQQMLPVRREELLSFLHLLSDKAAAGGTVDVGAELMTMTINTISRMTISHTCLKAEEVAEMRKLVHDVAELKGNFAWWIL